MYFKAGEDIKVMLPINNAKIYYNVSKGEQKKYSIDAAPKNAVKSATFDTYFAGTNIRDTYVDYWNKEGNCAVTGTTKKALKLGFQDHSMVYIYLPGVHHIVYSDNFVHEVGLSNGQFFFKDKKNVYVKGFVGVSDKVIFGVMSYDDTMKIKTFYIKEVSPNSAAAVLDATGLPEPIEKNYRKIYMKEDFWYKLKDINDELRSKEKFKDYKIQELHGKMYKQYRYMMMELFSKYIGEYDPEKYKLNLTAIHCNKTTKEIIDRCTYIDYFKRKYFGCRSDSKLRAKIGIDFNRVLIKIAD
jgi:hypothetical protein